MARPPGLQQHLWGLHLGTHRQARRYWSRRHLEVAAPVVQLLVAQPPVVVASLPLVVAPLLLVAPAVPLLCGRSS